MGLKNLVDLREIAGVRFFIGRNYGAVQRVLAKRHVHLERRDVHFLRHDELLTTFIRFTAYGIM